MTIEQPSIPASPEDMEKDLILSDSVDDSDEIKIMAAESAPDTIDALLKSSAEAIEMLGTIKAVREENIKKLFEALEQIVVLSMNKDKRSIEKDAKILALTNNIVELSSDLGRVTGTLLSLVKKIKEVSEYTDSASLTEAMTLANSIISTHKEKS